TARLPHNGYVGPWLDRTIAIVPATEHIRNKIPPVGVTFQDFFAHGKSVVRRADADQRLSFRQVRSDAIHLVVRKGKASAKDDKDIRTVDHFRMMELVAFPWSATGQDGYIIAGNFLQMSRKGGNGSVRFIVVRV